MPETVESEFYSSCDDRELIFKIREGDEDALAVLVSRYMKTVYEKARLYSIQGYETEDIVQEGLIGFLQAIPKYNADLNYTFYTFANTCIENRIKKTMQYANTNKFKAIDRSVSIDSLPAEDKWNDSSATPEEIVIAKEKLDAVKIGVDTLLSNLERDVLFLYLNGEDYQTISLRLNTSRKAVDNALQRIRRKLKNVK